jgi:hypothetical protein
MVLIVGVYDDRAKISPGTPSFRGLIGRIASSGGRFHKPARQYIGLASPPRELS